MEILIQNKKARFNYEIVEEMNAGIELLGSEVKSLRAKQGTLDGAYVLARGGEAYLVGATIPAFQPNNTSASYEPDRNRKLLLTKKELVELTLNESKKGLTIVPLSVYNAGRHIKVRLAIVRGKKQFDKRETIKQRDTEREMRRTLKNSI